MSQATSGRRLFFLLTIVAIGAGDAWAAWQWTLDRQEMEFSRRQWAECESLAHRIDALRHAPRRVDETVRTVDALAKLVESAAQQAGLTGDRIVRVAPGAPRRLGDTPFLEQATDVEIRDATLKQFVEFSLAVHRLAPSLRLTTLTLRVPPSEQNSNASHELWNAQLVLTSRVFAPKIPAPKT